MSQSMSMDQGPFPVSLGTSSYNHQWIVKTLLNRGSSYSIDIAMTLNVINDEIVSCVETINRVYPGFILMEKISDHIPLGLTEAGRLLYNAKWFDFAEPNGGIILNNYKNMLNPELYRTAVDQQWFETIMFGTEAFAFPGTNVRDLWIVLSHLGRLHFNGDR